MLARLIFVDGVSPSQALIKIDPSSFSSSRVWHHRKNHAVRLVSKLRNRARLVYPGASWDEVDALIRDALMEI